MIPAFIFYFCCSAKNLLRARLLRLRQPKYLISLIAGALYLYAIVFRPFMHGDRVEALRNLPDSGPPPWLETGSAILLFCIVLLPWVFPSTKAGLAFSEAEIQFLFPAPMSRRTLLRYRLLKAQLGILLGVFVSFVVFGLGRTFPRSAYLIAGFWIIYSFVTFYRMGAALVQTNLAEHGSTGLRRQLWVVALATVAVLSALLWVGWFLPPPPALKDLTPGAVLTWISALGQSGPAYYLLFPFRVLVRPALAQEPHSFFLSLVPALFLLWLSYVWVIRSDTRFEEASLERAERAARRQELAPRGEHARAMNRRTRRPPFDLAAKGPPFVAIFWKNLMAAAPLERQRIIPWLVLSGVIAISTLALGASKRAVVSAVIGSTALGIAGFLTFFGPVVQRDDLRADLLHADWIKSFPLPGWAVVLGEVLAPATVLSCLQWGLLVVGACFLPSMGPYLSSAYQRLVYALGAAMLIPCFSLIGILIQNGALVFFPGWIQPGREQPQGIEAMGQRMITMMATLLVLLFAVVPGAIVFALAFFLGYWLLGLAIIPVASLIAALGLLLEAVLVVLWLGRKFEKLDPSVELHQS